VIKLDDEATSASWKIVLQFREGSDLRARPIDPTARLDRIRSKRRRS